MNYFYSIERLREVTQELAPSQATIAPRRKFDLAEMRTLLVELGQPQTRFRSVLIAGTNGKGSTAATLAAILAAAGLRIGLYTSPHLLRVNERVRVSGADAHGELLEIRDEDFAAAFTEVYEAAARLVQRGGLPQMPSFFELLTALAFVHFARAGVQVAVLEVGLGGRLDATNVVEPMVSVITDIGMDHMEYLGNTLGEIAREKAGILRQDGVLVTLSQHPEANAAIGEVAVALGVRGVDASRCLPARGFSGVPVAGSPLPRNRYRLPIEGEVLEVDSPLAGQHQQRNLALAVATALELRANHGLTMTNQAIEAGVRATVWPGRLEFVAGSPGRPDLLLDVAHNPAGAWTLRAALSQLPEDRPRTLVFSCLADKPVRELAQVLFPLFDSASGDALRAGDHVVLAPLQNARAASVDQLLEAAHAVGVPAHAAPHVAAALAEARAVTPPGGLIVVTGSVFLVGEVRGLLLAERAAAVA